MVKVRPITAPPPMPCRPRKKISWFMPSSGSGMLPAAPHSHDETTKMTRSSEVEPLAAVEVGELGEHRHRDGRGEQVGGGHPRVAVEAVEAGDDARHGGADDGLVHRRQQQREHQAAEGGECAGGRRGGRSWSPRPRRSGVEAARRLASRGPRPSYRAYRVGPGPRASRGGPRSARCALARRRQVRAGCATRRPPPIINGSGRWRGPCVRLTALLLGGRSTVGHHALDVVIGVRIPASQP